MKIASIIISVGGTNTLSNTFFELLSNYESINDYEIIVVEDSSTSLFGQDYFKSKGLDTVTLISTNKNVGYGCANNMAVNYANEKNIIFINDDIILTNGCLEKLVLLLNNGQADAVQPKLLFPQSNKIQSTGHTFTKVSNAHLYMNANKDLSVANIRESRTALTTALCATHRELFDKMNGFNEIYYNAWEGMEYTLKLTMAGYKCVYEPTAEAYHIRGGSRGLYKINEDPQNAYFWSMWSNKIPEDLHKYYIKQIDKPNKQYILLNFSSHMSPFSILNNSNIKICDYINYILYSGNTQIDLLKIIPIGLASSKIPFLYLCDNFKQIQGNALWFEMRKDVGDMICDLCGNVIIID